MFSSCVKTRPTQEMTMGLPAMWGDILPHAQNNYYGSHVILAVYDALLGTDKTGATIPLGARDWKISPDFKTLTFYIDTSKRFSDGSFLSAGDYKKAWEFALKENPNAYNSNVGDVFYKVEGVSEFAKRGHVTGFVVESDQVLKVKFKKPFRRGLDSLKGARFAVSKQVGSSFIGTGNFVVVKKSKTYVKLKPNIYARGYDGRKSLQVKVVAPIEAGEALRNGDIDFYFSAGFNPLLSLASRSRDVDIVYGQENLHSMITLNGMGGRFFSNRKLRLGIQSLLHKIFSKREKSLKISMGINYSRQVYPPLQLGSIANSEVHDILEAGDRYIPALIKESRQRPLIFYFHSQWSWLFEELQSRGIVLADQSIDMQKNKRDVLKEFYKKFTPDLITGEASFAGGDPDGLHHLLGKNGAIASPMSYRKSVADVLEIGRYLLDPAKIKKTYEKVTTEVLKEVPFVHIGFMPSVTLYNSQRVKPLYKVIDRNENVIDGFRAK